MTEAAQLAASIRVALRQSLAKPVVLISAGVLILITFLLMIGIALLQPYQLTTAASQAMLYLVALFEIFLGIRVGLLRLSGKESDYAISASARFWRRSLPYLVPALLLPLPVLMAITGSQHATANWLLLLASLITSYLQFFLITLAATVWLRRISSNIVARLTLLFFGLLATILLLNSDNFLFREVFIFQRSGDQIILLSILAHLGVIALSELIIESLLQTIRIRPRLFGRYWPVLRLAFLPGYGQGSSSFFQTNRLLIRDSRLQRRLAALLLGMFGVVAVSVISTTLDPAYQFTELVWKGLLLLLAATAAFNIAEIAHLRPRWAGAQRYLPTAIKEITVGSWFSGWLWLLAFMIILTGLLAPWQPLGGGDYGVLALAATTQYLLLFGWQGKLRSAAHQLVAKTVVFLLAVIIGFVPLAIWSLAPLPTVAVVQSMWLLFTGILLLVTSPTNAPDYA